MMARLLAVILTLTAVWACPSLSFAQLGDLPTVEPAPDFEPGAQLTVAPATPVVPASAPYRVHLAVDGHVPGSVKVLDATGVLIPVRATISVFQNGLLLSTTHANERGRFQLPGLRPGMFTVIADAGTHMGVFAVEVLPCKDGKDPFAPVSMTTAADDGSPEGTDTLDLILMNPTDGEGLVEEVIVDEGYAVMSGGGGGGGGGALVGLLGLAGLAGLGGLGGSGAASPNTN